MNYLLLEAQPSAATKTEFLVLQKAALQKAAQDAQSSRFSFRTLFLLQNLLNLSKVVQIMTGKQRNRLFDRLPAPLGMNPMVLPLIGREGLQQCEIGFPGNAELLQRLAGIAVFVMSTDDPGILIEGFDRRARCAEDHPHAETAHDFRLGQVRKNLINRPSPGSGAQAKF